MACISAVFYDIICRHGRLAERSKAAVLKTVDAKVSGGSNPSPSAIKRQHPLPFLFIRRGQNPRIMPHRGISGLHAIVPLAFPIGNRCKANPSAIKRQRLKALSLLHRGTEGFAFQRLAATKVCKKISVCPHNRVQLEPSQGLGLSVSAGATG